jgi:hypothetical protein
MRSVFLLLIIFIVSCTAEEKIPSGILPEKKMLSILWDMSRADEYTMNHIHKDSTLDEKSESIKLYEKIFLLHKTTQAEVSKSFKYYETHPELFKPILDSLDRKRASIYQDQYSRPPALDTTRNKRLE